MPSVPPTLVGSHLTRTFIEGTTEKKAVNDVSLDFYPGQMVLLMGPSGSGKSTLLALLSGLMRPSEGKVLVLGTDVWALEDPQREDFRRRNFGFIFQGYNLFASLTPREQLELVLRWVAPELSAKEVRKRVDEMLKTLGLTNKEIDALPAKLSGGEKQRVAIGRALLNKPAFCFADEPTSALDWENGEKVVQLLKKAAKERNATVLTVTHDERLVPEADRVYHLSDGKLVEQGTS